MHYFEIKAKTFSIYLKIIRNNNCIMDFSMNESDCLKETDDDLDPVVKEIDVYLAKSLSNNIYVLQVNTNMT